MFFILSSSAQEVPSSQQIQLENLVDANEVEVLENEDFILKLERFTRDPLNLNTAMRDELKLFYALNDLQIDNFLKYRQLLGKFISVYELQSVPTWNVTTIKKLLPYITVNDYENVHTKLKARLKEGNHQIVFRISRALEKSSAYDSLSNNFYLGDRNHLSMQYRYDYKGLLQYGFSADKDAGEQFFKGVQSKGFDFYSFHFFAREIGKIKSIVVGDFSVNLGQGLIHWNSMAFKKSAEVIAIKRQSPVLLPYRSTGEFYFSRGGGITLRKEKTEASVFVSFKKIAGNISSDSSEVFTAFNTSGLYRTRKEISIKNNLGLRSFGGNISYRSTRYEIGINAIVHQFSLPLLKRDEPYNYFAISGSKWLNASMHYSYTFKNVHLFGEAALDKNFNWALIKGAMISLDEKADLSLFYRNIQKNYQSVFGNAFTENTLPSNENGFYAGISLRPVHRWHINAYTDFYSFPWLRYRVDGPTRGRDHLIQVQYQPGKKFQVYSRYRYELKSINQQNGTFNYPGEILKRNLRVHFSNILTTDLEIRSRVDINWYQVAGEEMEQGFLTYIETYYNYRSLVSGSFRLQYFETGGYNSRAYAYESDVLYSFSIPSFFDKGFRYYLNLKAGLGKHLYCWFRIARTVCPDKTSISSGNEKIHGNKRSEIKLQLRYEF